MRERAIIAHVFVSIFTTAVAQITASASKSPHPVDKCAVKRNRLKVEEELRIALRTLRQSIDRYKIACESALVAHLNRTVNDECYPHSLEALVAGVRPPNHETPIRYLRRIPIDPTTGKRPWGLRSMQDEPTALEWGGQNVFDVYSLSKGRALDRSRYSDW
jgi:general secretion pathway protein G